MDHNRYDDTYIADILGSVRTVAIIGASANTSRPSYFVFKYLLLKGYKMIPVNPGLAVQDLLGQKVVASLDAIEEPVDMVDVFRASDAAPEIVADCIRLKERLRD